MSILAKLTGQPPALPVPNAKVAKNDARATPLLPSGKPDPAPSTTADQVQLTTTNQLQALSGRKGSDTPFDAGKVAAIQQAIKDGRYPVNPERIADEILQSTRELLASRKAG